MDRTLNNASAVTCKLCGEAFTLPENDQVDSNLPRVLLCGHVYCTSCLLSIQCDAVITCPECQTELTVPECGVYGLEEDSRIIGLIYTAKIHKNKSLQSNRSKRRTANKIPQSTDENGNTKDVQQVAHAEQMVDEALAQAAENLAQLEHIHESLATDLAEQVRTERVRLEMEIQQAVAKALHAVQKWKDVQLHRLTKLEAYFSTSQTQLCEIQERIKSLEIAMQKAREIRRIPVLEQYCSLDTVLETLQAPVDKKSFSVKYNAVGSGLSCAFQSQALNQNLSLLLQMEVRSPICISESAPNSPQLGKNTGKPPLRQPEGRSSSSASPSRRKFPTKNISPQESTPSTRPRQKVDLVGCSSFPDLQSPDVIIEEFLDEEQALPPTGPELANDKWRTQKRGRNKFKKKTHVTMWVVVTHIVNPSHFYVRYVAEKKENEALSRKVNQLCWRDSCRFAFHDKLEMGSGIFVKWREGLWCRATIVELLTHGCAESVMACSVRQLANIKVFFIDNGLTRSISIQSSASEDGTVESLLTAVNEHLKKVDRMANVELHHIAPQAIRCSLKDLVPYDLSKGWSKEAKIEFHNLVGSAAVEMRPLGQDTDSLLVDLRKVPMDQSSDVSISVREFLVFIEVARFYSPVTFGRKPLLFYPPVYPKLNTEVNAVVSHINNPADFYIQLVENMESLLLSAKLQDYYNTTTVARENNLSVYCPVIGQAYVARYENSWYRAQVIGHPGGRKVEVRYVDYGNEGTVFVSDLRKLKDEFFALPIKAIHCSLSEVTPQDGGTWSDECVNKFISLAHQKPVTIVATGTICKPKPLQVKLFESSLNGPPTNIAELLVHMGLASFKGGLKSEDSVSPPDDSVTWDPPVELGAASDVGDEARPEASEQEEEALEFEPQLKLPAHLKDLKVRVSHVNSPSSFYVQLIQNNSRLKRLCKLLKQECALAEPQCVEWKAGMYCAALNNGVWERGQICADVTSSNIAEVMRCDHGNTVKLDISKLQPLPQHLVGSFALECTLTDIRPAGGQSTWTATACDFISDYLRGASAAMTIKELTDDRPFPVTLLFSNKMGKFVSTADFLVSEGLALRDRKPREAAAERPKQTDVQSPASKTQAAAVDKKTFPRHTSNQVPPKPAPRTITSAERVKTQLYQPPELPCLGPLQVHVSAIGEDGLIYVRTHNAECQLEQLQGRIQQSMKTLPRPKPYTWKSVQGCAVIGPDMFWYRGQLLEVLGEHVKVQYVDYGIVESIPVVHVYPILLCEDIPQLCLPCQLHGLNPVGERWQCDALALMEEMFLKRSVDIQLKELPTDPRDPLTVELFLDSLSLSTIMCQLEHAAMDRTVLEHKEHSGMSPACLDEWDIDSEDLRGPKEPLLGPFVLPNLPKKGEQIQVRVKHLLTPNKLFLWPLEGAADVVVDGETLSEALTRINADIDSLPQLDSFPPGCPCLAEYSDQRYYRAQLIEIISVEPAKVLIHHVDFGSDDTLLTTKIRQMPAELLRFPVQALKVKVAGFKPPSVSLEEDELPYSPEWSVRAVLEMVDLLHTNITASVVACDPELTVLLYNEDGELVHLPLVSSGLAELE